MTEALDREWDLIVVGTGMGGGTLGRAMAEKGWSVLFVEKGRQGFRSEQQSLSPLVTEPRARQLRGYWPEPVTARVDGRESRFYAALGSGVGGSSVFYAGTLERPEPRDLAPTPDCPHPTGGWPFGWDEFQPWLDAAAHMYRVRPTAEVGPEDAAILARLRANGRQPVLLGSAIAGLPGCLDCRGVKCPRPCKMDARSAGVEPALATGRATLLDECEVLALRADAQRVTHIEALHQGQQRTLRARHFALAAGALSSPRLLLASDSAEWPQGLGNANDLVGRHLMFHLNEMFAVWPPTAQRTGQPSKAVGLRDLYTADSQRLGMVQAMGVNVAYGEIAHFLRERLVARGWPRLARLSPLMGLAASRVLGQAKLFVGLLEDLPYATNRVTLDRQHPDRICFEYTLAPELLARRQAFRRQIRRAFRGMRPVFVNLQPELNHGHPCGTLRAGHDPRTSVLNAQCQVHGVHNLHVVDASFFPTSMGVNPSLTIAANALRVAHHLHGAAA